MEDNQTVQLSIRAHVSYPGFELDVDEDLELKGVTGLFGPSGSGKSTLLRIMAGLERASSGRVTFGNETWQDSDARQYVPAHRRPVGYVFQDARLFAHLPVEGNLRYASDRSPKHRNPIKYDDVLATFDLEPLLGRSVDSLSGGERQRVAISRTLLAQPKLLLLDEPLSALDVGRKREILPYLDTLAGHFGLPIIYVSHAVDEIVRLAETVMVLDQGQVRAVGAAAETLNRLDIQSHAARPDIVTILETTVTEHLAELGLTRLEHHGQSIVVPLLEHIDIAAVARLYIKATDVALATEKPANISFRNILSGKIESIDIDESSAFATVSVNVNGAVVRSNVTRHAVQDLKLEMGLPVFALLKTASFDRS